MTQNQKTQIEALLKAGQVAVDTQTREIDKDPDGFPVFETVFETPPTNYRLVKLIEAWNGAVLEDLDHGKETA